VDPVETVPLEEPEEPTLDEAELLDPLLEEESFEDLSLDPLSREKEDLLSSEERELVEEEPVGEEALAVRSPLESPEPTYPRAAYLRKLEGTVVLIMLVDPDGAVTEVEVIQSSGHRLLDRAALVAARGYRFEAGEESMTVNKTYTFRLP
jgi:TonB family protein